MFVAARSLIALAAAAASVTCFAVTPYANRDALPMTRDGNGGMTMDIPLNSWPVDTKSFIEQHRAMSTAAGKGGNLKAATDRATVYRPVKVCRLIDTRGGPAFINIPGPLLAGSITNVSSAGVCGIPSGIGVAGISISFHVLNLTVNNGGTIAFLQQGAPLNGVNAVFNPGAQWTAATANISLPDDSGNFEISITNSNVQVVVDVNGYYQDLDFVDTGAQELNINGTVAAGGTVFEVTNLGAGNALAASNLGNGAAFNINAGSFKVSGAAIGSGTTAFIAAVNTSSAFGSGGNVCGGAPSIMVIDHPMLNGDSSAMLLITPREGSTIPAPTGSAGAVAAIYLSGECSPSAANHWGIRDKSGAALVNNAQYSVFIIKSQ